MNKCLNNPHNTQQQAVNVDVLCTCGAYCTLKARGCHKCAAWKVLQGKRLWFWPLNTLNWNYCELHLENNWLIKNIYSEHSTLQKAGDPQYTKPVINKQIDVSFSSKECSQQIIKCLFQFHLFGLTVSSQCNRGEKSSIQSWKVCRQQPREP